MINWIKSLFKEDNADNAGQVIFVDQNEFVLPTGNNDIVKSLLLRIGTNVELLNFIARREKQGFELYNKLIEEYISTGQ